MNYKLKTEFTITENILFKIPEEEYNRTSSLEITPKQIIWEIHNPDIEEIYKITDKLQPLTQLVVEERENE